MTSLNAGLCALYLQRATDTPLPDDPSSPSWNTNLSSQYPLLFTQIAALITQTSGKPAIWDHGQPLPAIHPDGVGSRPDRVPTFSVNMTTGHLQAPAHPDDHVRVCIRETPHEIYLHGDD